jgi:hypothetical protein
VIPDKSEKLHAYCRKMSFPFFRKKVDGSMINQDPRVRFRLLQRRPSPEGKGEGLYLVFEIPEPWKNASHADDHRAMLV